MGKKLYLRCISREVAWCRGLGRYSDRECMACFLVNKGEAAPNSSDLMRQLLGIFGWPEC